jgi:hypothetical protein
MNTDIYDRIVVLEQQAVELELLVDELHKKLTNRVDEVELYIASIQKSLREAQADIQLLSDSLKNMNVAVTSMTPIPRRK